MKLRIVGSVALFLAVAQVAMASTTWYVDGLNGRDSNDCKSATTACKTIGHAISLASSGNVIMVAAATYPENLVIPFSLKIIGAGAGTTILDGGGIATVVTIPYRLPASQVTLSKVTIRNGFGGPPLGVGIGGGVLNNGDLYIIYCVITGNSAGGIGSSGGGVVNAGNATMTIINKTTISGNRAAFGGGVFCGGNGDTKLVIYNSTISDNVAGQTTGGGIYNGCKMTITNDTISRNTGNGITLIGVSLKINNSTISANNGGGIWTPTNAGGLTASIQNSIVANNKGGNCSGNVTVSDGYNLSSDGTCTFFNAAGDLNNTDPVLGPLQRDSGPTSTMPLLSGSPAIDSGNPTGCTDGYGHPLLIDQRGLPRPNKEDSGGCDRGAFELQGD